MTQLEHLLTADAVFRGLGWDQPLRAIFYLGAIAPDAHRVSYGVDRREMHFLGGRRVRHGMAEFMRTYLRPALADPLAEEARAFYAGWLTHLSADKVLRARVRHELPDLWKQALDSASIVGAVLRDQFYEECDWVDGLLYAANVTLLEDIRGLLGQAPTYFTVPPLRLVDIQRWRQQVIADMLPVQGGHVESPQYVTEDLILRSMDLAQAEALGILDTEIKRVSGTVA
jgi:hypothetical protein